MIRDRPRFPRLIKRTNTRHCETANRRSVARVTTGSSIDEGIAKEHVSTIDVAVRWTISDFKIKSRVYTHGGSDVPGTRMNAELEPLEKDREHERAFLTSRGGARSLSWPARGNSARSRVSKLDSSCKLAASGKAAGPIFVRLFAVVGRARTFVPRFRRSDRQRREQCSRGPGRKTEKHVCNYAT